MSVHRLSASDAGFELLEWDSNFFGFGVAKLNLGAIEPSTLAQQLKELKERNTRLVYWPAPADDAQCKQAAERCGGRMVGCQVLFEQSDNHPLVREIVPFTEYTEHFPNQSLIDLAITSGEFSRYSNDPMISRDKFVDLYVQWISNCAARKVADHILIEEYGGKTAGMVCLRKRQLESKIVLIAVGKGCQGAGIGTSLVKAALSLGRENGCSTHSVVTYKENAAACRLFEKCGYAMTEQTDYYHFWL